MTDRGGDDSCQNRYFAGPIAIVYTERKNVDSFDLSNKNITNRMIHLGSLYDLPKQLMIT